MESEETNIFRAEREPLQITFLVLAGASIMCVASAIDPLRAANRMVGRPHFKWTIVSVDGKPPRTTSGLPVEVDGVLDPKTQSDVFIVVGGFGSRTIGSARLYAMVRRIARSSRAVGAIEAGTWLLGHAGLLEGRKTTTHWEDLEDFASEFPGTDVFPDRYVIDGALFTSGGASPTFDLMLHLIRSRLGMAVALDVASIFIYDQARMANDRQPLVSLGRPDGYDPRLAAAIRLMESHIDKPLTVSAIARRCGVTARTMELVFTRSIGETPGAYYMRLRLNAARRLVLDTLLPMADVAARSGFSTAAAFTRAFARIFGHPPSRLRKNATTV